MPRLAVFVSPHGFGHAARAAAVIAALARRRPGLEVTLWTTVPRWFFAESLALPFDYRECRCDVGLVQTGPLTEDLGATVAALEALWGGDESKNLEPDKDKDKDKGFQLRGAGPGAPRSGAEPGGGGSSLFTGSLGGDLRSGALAGGGGSSSFSGAVGEVLRSDALPGDAESSLFSGALGGSSLFSGVVREVVRSGARAVLCDISPFGLAVAAAAGVPSVLVENFTWDWIYEGYVGAERRLGPWISRLGPLFASAAVRVQAEPVCRPVAGSVTVPPVARAAQRDGSSVRARLGIGPGRAMVLVSMGGVPPSFSAEALAAWRRLGEVDFVVPGALPGGAGAGEERRGNLVLLPHHSPVHHPDLVRAADVVVGKLGYSTVAEAFAAGTRMAYLPRPAFRESAVLERFVADRLPALALDPTAFESGSWVELLPELLSRPRPAPGDASGAEATAAAIAPLLD